MQQACGDNKSIFKLVIMHSAVATNLENLRLMKGEALPVGICDDHELHLAAHRRAALDYAYDKLRRKNPAAAQALEAHIALHTEKLNLAKEKQNA